MQTKIFLDSSDPAETKEALELLGALDGQTTNPTLLAHSPLMEQKKAAGELRSKHDIKLLYKAIIEDIADLIPEGSLSVEVYADTQTTADEMIEEGKEMALWAPKVHVKLPTTLSGIEAAHMLTQSGFRVNMTLVFSQQQVGAVYETTSEARAGEVYVSPFVGRLDDTGVSGVSLIENIQTMLATGDAHVEVLMASVRDVETLIWGVENKVDAVTAPLAVLKEWVSLGKPEALTDEQRTSLQVRGEKIAYDEIDLQGAVHSYELSHELTDVGLERFADDYNSLLES